MSYRLPKGPTQQDALGRIIDGNGGLDEAENSYYEAWADPAYARIEAARRRFGGQNLRRLKHLTHRAATRTSNCQRPISSRKVVRSSRIAKQPGGGRGQIVSGPAAPVVQAPLQFWGVVDQCS